MQHSRLGIGLTRLGRAVLPGSLLIVLAMTVTLLTLTGLVNGAAARRDSRHVAVPSLQLNLAPVVTSGLTQPVYVTHAGDSRLFIVERAGIIRIFQGGSLLSQPFLDINGLVQDAGSEEGLLGLAFPPGFGPGNPRFYVYYVNNSGNLALARYRVSAGNPNVANPSSAEIVLTILHPGNSNHNGGQLAFGPRDGYLYLGPGDGGGGGDPGENAQDPAELLGKILRIDVETGDPSTYTIPPSNPYATTPGYRPEIWDLGVRNPFRFSFDRATGDLFIADVGQNNVEEIDHEPAGDPGGRNYGWDCYEGSTPYETAGCGPAANYVFPVWQYTHALGCSVTGGYVYRGQLFPVMSGIYFYGDFCSGRIWGLSFDGTSWQNTEYLDSAVRLSSFGEDVNGEVYVVDLNGAVYRLEGDSTTQTRTFYSKGAYDGWVLESSETSGTGGNINVTATTIRLGDNALNRQYRSILDFATGSLPDNAQIVSATLCIKRYSLIGTSPFATHKGLLVDIRKWAYSGSRDLQSTDFQAAAQLNEAATIPNAPSNGWYCGSLSDPALSYIHLIGRTQVRLRFELDDNNDNGADYLNFYSGNTSANPAYRPRLTVEYSVP